MIGISRSIQPNRKQNKHKEKNTAEAKHQSSPITLLVDPEWCLVSIKEWSYSGIIDPIEGPLIGPWLKSLSHSEDEGVRKRIRNVSKATRERAMCLPWMYRMFPLYCHKATRTSSCRIVQEGEIQYSNDGTKELRIGKEEKGCQNCNWFGTKDSYNLWGIFTNDYY